MLVEAAKLKVNYVISVNSFLPLLIIFLDQFFILTAPLILLFLTHVPFPSDGFSDEANTKLGDVTVWQDSASEPQTPGP